MNRLAGAGTSFLILMVGAMLSFVNVNDEGFDVTTASWILIGVGSVGLMLSLLIATAGTTVIESRPTGDAS
jgi:hypothetical protein